jgi:predicted DNA-binding protein with PD1-like motif
MTEDILVLNPEPNAELVAWLCNFASTVGVDLWVDGFGELDDVTVTLSTEAGATVSRSLKGRVSLLSLRGEIARSKPPAFKVLVAREGALGPLVLGGELVSARVSSVRVRVAPSTSSAESRPAAASSATEARSPAVVIPQGPSPVLVPAPSVSAPTTPSASGSSPGSPALPKKPAQAIRGHEIYPEEGDQVNHFAFGLCTVVFSDGERIRLQNSADGRVREVALSMLKIEEPIDVDGKRYWELSRRH